MGEDSQNSGDSDEFLSDKELDIDKIDDQITSGCTCGHQCAHDKTCPMNPRRQRAHDTAR